MMMRLKRSSERGSGNLPWAKFNPQRGSAMSIITWIARKLKEMNDNVLRQQSLAAVEASPAHAGIDLEQPELSLTTSRFPRTRGDRPPPPEYFVQRVGLPPHTRG